MYTISYKTLYGGPYFLGKRAESGVADLLFAAVFPSVGEAVSHYSSRKCKDRGVKVLRVEETPGVSERVVLGEIEPATSTPKYAAQYAGLFFGGNSWGASLPFAKLYDTQGEAIAEIVDHGRSSSYGGGGFAKTVSLVRVVEKSTAPTRRVAAEIG
jgi:hypothetical protein